jgi:hypothetical protein
VQNEWAARFDTTIEQAMLLLVDQAAVHPVVAVPVEVVDGDVLRNY